MTIDEANVYISIHNNFTPHEERGARYFAQFLLSTLPSDDVPATRDALLSALLDGEENWLAYSERRYSDLFNDAEEDGAFSAKHTSQLEIRAMSQCFNGRQTAVSDCAYALEKAFELILNASEAYSSPFPPQVWLEEHPKCFERECPHLAEYPKGETCKKCFSGPPAPEMIFIRTPEELAAFNAHAARASYTPLTIFRQVTPEEACGLLASKTHLYDCEEYLYYRRLL